MASNYELPPVPSARELERMSSEELSDLSASLTGAKDKFQKDYRTRQENLHKRIAEKQKKEREDRIKQDPDYWKKHQGIQ